MDEAKPFPSTLEPSHPAELRRAWSHLRLTPLSTQQDLECYDLADLAAFCQRLADDPYVHEPTAQEAWRLKREWVVLVAKETPPPASRLEYELIQAAKRALRMRMAKFLAAAIV
jgi:hypothetical protein